MKGLFNANSKTLHAYLPVAAKLQVFTTSLEPNETGLSNLIKRLREGN